MAPLTSHHTCGACGCHVPVDAAYDELLLRMNHVTEQLIKTKRKLKDCWKGKR